MKNFNFKKYSFFIFFLYLINLSDVKSDEFWSNTIDGPTTKEQAIKLLEGKNLDPIEGLWYEEEIGTIVIFEENDVFKMYIVEGPTEFNGTWEATIIKTGSEYDFLSRIWYNQVDGYTYSTQTGVLEIFDDYFLTKYDSLSDGGVNMDSKYTRVWPSEEKLVKDDNQSDREKKFYELNWFNLDDPKNHWVEIENSNSEVNILKTEIYLKGQNEIDKYENLLFGNDALENNLLILDNESYDYSIYVNYINSGYVSIDNWKSISAEKIMQELKATAKKDVTDVKWVFKPEISDKNYISYSYETNWIDRDKTFETKIISLGRQGYNEVLFVFNYDDDSDTKEFREIAIEFAETMSFKEGFRYEDFKPGDKVASKGIEGLLADSFGVESIVKLSNFREFLNLITNYTSITFYPIISIFNFNSK